jgi:ribosomal protein S18 acetylase RimI-like enzyme
MATWPTCWAATASFALVALDGDEVIGGLVAYELPKLEQARHEIYIYDLAVAAAHRRRARVATALIGWLQQVAASRGAWRDLRAGRPRRRPGDRPL